MENKQKLSTPITQSNYSNILDGIDNFLFDCDGVLWRNSKVIPGVPETLKWLRSKGKRVLFVSNNSTLSRNQYVEKIRSLGIDCDKEEIYPSCYAMALYLKEIGFNKKAYLVGSEGFAKELDEMNISWRGINEHSKLNVSLHEASQIETDPEIGAVLVGFDINFCYYKLSFAFKHLQNKDCLFVATNTDSTFPSGEGQLLPGGGSVVRMIECCVDRNAFVVGKPSQWFLDAIVNKLSLDRNRTIMVGDRLDTDILFGNQGDLKSLLVFSGVATKEDLTNQNNTIFPDYTLETISDILQYIK